MGFNLAKTGIHGARGTSRADMICTWSDHPLRKQASMAGDGAAPWTEGHVDLNMDRVMR